MASFPGGLGISSRRRKDKVVIVMGTTGTGKSRLAIEFATRFAAEVDFYFRRALQAEDSDSILPIIVGGSNSYINSIDDLASCFLEQKLYKDVEGIGTKKVREEESQFEIERNMHHRLLKRGLGLQFDRRRRTSAGRIFQPRGRGGGLNPKAPRNGGSKR